MMKCLLKKKKKKSNFVYYCINLVGFVTYLPTPGKYDTPYSYLLETVIFYRTNLYNLFY